MLTDQRQDEILELREMAYHGLKRMFNPDKHLFVYRINNNQGAFLPQGASLRYTCMAVIGLACGKVSEAKSTLTGIGLNALCERLINEMVRVQNLGDLALILWACRAVGRSGCHGVVQKIVSMKPEQKSYPIIELAWTLDALCLAPHSRFDKLIRSVANSLLQSFNPQTGVFPHVTGGDGKSCRSHVSSFADLVYPIHALSNYARLYGDQSALAAAQRCGDLICERQGPAGQWWWHYDYRTGRVVERYPVYSVHQDAMAPMALFALEEAGGSTRHENIAKGLKWIYHSPEVDAPIIDRKTGLIWRKVCRREPRKLVRYVQAISSWMHPDLRIPGMDVIFPPNSIDYEDRPYHLGWILFAWNLQRIEKMRSTTILSPSDPGDHASI